MVSPVEAASTEARRVPAPESAVLVTVMVLACVDAASSSSAARKLTLAIPFPFDGSGFAPSYSTGAGLTNQVAFGVWAARRSFSHFAHQPSIAAWLLSTGQRRITSIANFTLELLRAGCFPSRRASHSFLASAFAGVLGSLAARTLPPLARFACSVARYASNLLCISPRPILSNRFGEPTDCRSKSFATVCSSSSLVRCSAHRRAVSYRARNRIAAWSPYIDFSVIRHDPLGSITNAPPRPMAPRALLRSTFPQRESKSAQTCWR